MERTVWMFLFSATLALSQVPQSEASCLGSPWIDLKTDKCYLINQDVEVTREEAQCICKKTGPSGTLVNLRSAEEWKGLRAYITLTERLHLWIGLKRKTLNDPFLWTDGTTLTYTNWGETEPNNLRGDEKCVAIFVNVNGWSDIWCDFKTGYICSTEKAKCPSLANQNLVEESGTCKAAYAGQSCTVRCKPGLQLMVGSAKEGSGKLTATCQVSGQWNYVPTCQAPCPKLPNEDILWKSGTCDGAVPGEHCTVKCKAGLQLMTGDRRVTSGELKVNCQAWGVWDATPKCQVPCPKLTNEDILWKSGTCDGAVPGERCTVKCNEGLQLMTDDGKRTSGELQVTCQASGQWDVTPKCQGPDCQDYPTDRGETWAEACERLNKPCVVDSKEGPRCGCQRGRTEVSLCVRKTKMLQEFLDYFQEGRSKN